MTPKEQKESVFGLKKEEEGEEGGEEEGERKRGEKEKNSFTKHVFINGFLDSVLSEVCKKERKKNKSGRLDFYIIKYITTWEYYPFKGNCIYLPHMEFSFMPFPKLRTF